MKPLTLTITGMSCGHCLNAVNRALSSLPGVELKGVQIGRAEVIYDAGVTDSAAVIAAVEAAGYSCQALSDSEREQGPTADFRNGGM